MDKTYVILGVGSKQMLEVIERADVRCPISNQLYKPATKGFDDHYYLYCNQDGRTIGWAYMSKGISSKNIMQEFNHYHGYHNTEQYVVLAEEILSGKWIAPWLKESEDRPPKNYRLVTDDEKENCVKPVGTKLWMNDTLGWIFACNDGKFFNSVTYCIPTDCVLEKKEPFVTLSEMAKEYAKLKGIELDKLVIKIDAII